ncbi:hypothetical protein Peur_016124 [Populus x canadensis]
MISFTKYFKALPLFMLFMTLSDACCTKRTQLSITNDLDSSSELLVHCKPRNYDLGLKSLSPHCSWSFDIVFRLMWMFVLVFTYLN